ncbi:MAG: hypothetical protein ISS13_00615 [Actinobacteria bacterium]|nr:hypothetical protein [Actinomycetota bacterium]MBL7060318.1 hypothetical protein [Actinomycetota bacterium]
MDKKNFRAFEKFNGIILVNKMRDMTSYNIIRELKKNFFLKKLVMQAH